MYLRILFFLFVLLHGSLGHAAILTMEGFNIQQCKHWYIEGGGAPPKDDKGFCTSRPELLQYCETLFTQDKSGKVISAACKVRLKSKNGPVDSYQCERINGHPMSNATYQLNSKDTEFSTYECVQGCTDDVASKVYNLGYETAAPIKFERDNAAFQKKCVIPKP